MKNKKVLMILISFVFIIICTVGCYFYVQNHSKKYYINSKYYNDKGLTDVSVKELEKKVKNKESFILFVYNDFCAFSIPCDSVFDEASKRLGVQILQVPYREFKKSSVKGKIKYAPTVIIYKEGKIYKYLDAESDDDKDLYQNIDLFKKWLLKYIYLEKN